MLRGVYIPSTTSPLPTRFISFPLMVPRPPVPLYIPNERAIPLAFVLALRLVGEFSDCPLGIWCGSRSARSPGYAATLYLPPSDVVMPPCPLSAPCPITHEPFGLPYMRIWPACCKCAACPASSSLAMSCSGCFSFVIVDIYIYLLILCCCEVLLG